MSESESAEFHEMREPRIEKIVVHMGVGEGGRELADAEDILEDVTGQRSVRTSARGTVQEFNIREGDPIGAKVTLRGDAAVEFLDTALSLVDLSATQFDETVNMVRPGYRVAKRDKVSRSIPSNHRLDASDAVAFVEANFDVEVTQ